MYTVDNEFKNMNMPVKQNVSIWAKAILCDLEFVFSSFLLIRTVHVPTHGSKIGLKPKSSLSL